MLVHGLLICTGVAELGQCEQDALEELIGISQVLARLLRACCSAGGRTSSKTRNVRVPGFMEAVNSLAGQAVGGVKEVLPAKTVVDQMVLGAVRILQANVVLVSAAPQAKL